MAKDELSKQLEELEKYIAEEKKRAALKERADTGDACDLYDESSFVPASS